MEEAMASRQVCCSAPPWQSLPSPACLPAQAAAMEWKVGDDQCKAGGPRSTRPGGPTARLSESAFRNFSSWVHRIFTCPCSLHICARSHGLLDPRCAGFTYPAHGDRGRGATTSGPATCRATSSAHGSPVTTSSISTRQGRGGSSATSPTTAIMA